MIKDPVQIEKIIQDVFASQKLVSVIIPTRKRFAQLKLVIDSLFELAKHPENVEVLIRVDDDDEDTINQLHTLSPNVKKIIGKRNGYENGHMSFWEMTQQATGEFVLAFCDDYYLTRHWDDHIQKYRGQICVIWTKGEHSFATHRSIPLVWESFGIAYTIDVYWKVVSLELGVYVRDEEFNIFHNHAGTTRDYIDDTNAFMWPNKKPLIYEMTDTLKPYMHPELFATNRPLTNYGCSFMHPINDYARGKIYWWPISDEMRDGYYSIKDAHIWFHPTAKYKNMWAGNVALVADPIPESEKVSPSSPKYIGQSWDDFERATAQAPGLHVRPLPPPTNTDQRIPCIG